MIVLNAGVPRSGTVLVNAILRQIYLRAGRRIGQSNPQGPFLPKLIRRLRDTGEDRSRTTLVHTHSWDEETAALLAEVAPLVGFACYRDPRDVAVSLMRLHDHALSTAVATTLHGFRAFEAVMRDRRVMAIPTSCWSPRSGRTSSRSAAGWASGWGWTWSWPSTGTRRPTATPASWSRCGPARCPRWCTGRA